MAHLGPFPLMTDDCKKVDLQDSMVMVNGLKTITKMTKKERKLLLKVSFVNLEQF